MKSRSAAEAIRGDIRKGASQAQESAARTAQGLREYQLQLISAAQANVNALFEYMQEAVQAQSISELIELSNSHSRRQFEMISDQTRELAASAQKIGIGSVAPPFAGIFGQGAQIS